MRRRMVVERRIVSQILRRGVFRLGAALAGAALAAGCAEAPREPAPAPSPAPLPADGPAIQANYVVSKAPPSKPDVIPAASKDQPRTTAIPIPGSGLVRARSTVVADAPIQRLREVVVGYAEYPEFMPHYKACRVLGRSPSGGRHVYIELGAAGGAMKLWARIDAKKPVVADGFETFESRLEEGNLKALEGTVRLRALDADHTEITLESFVRPNLPVPDAMLNRQNLDGARDAVLALKARSEQAGRAARR
jgi:ribosome-associated toxin RatA of RatAB toxin-antitoxin module